MKKIYIAPLMEVVDIHVSHPLLDTSTLSVGNDMNSGSADAPGMLNDDEIFQLFLIH